MVMNTNIRSDPSDLENDDELLEEYLMKKQFAHVSVCVCVCVCVCDLILLRNRNQ